VRPRCPPVEADRVLGVSACSGAHIMGSFIRVAVIVEPTSIVPLGTASRGFAG